MRVLLISANTEQTPNILYSQQAQGLDARNREGGG